MAGNGNIGAVRALHCVSQEAEIGLEYAEHVLHRLTGDAYFLTHDPLASIEAARQQHLGDTVGVLDSDIGLLVGQGRQGALPAKRLVERVAILLDFLGAHHCSRGVIHIDSRNNIYIYGLFKLFIDILPGNS